MKPFPTLLLQAFVLYLGYALVLSFPISIPLFCFSAQINPQYNVISAWIGFAYVSFISMLLAFFAWYRALELGGIAKIGQLQLLQPFITIFASASLFSEKISPGMFLVLAIVLASVYLGKRTNGSKNTPRRKTLVNGSK